MTPVDAAVERFYSLKPVQFPFLQELRLSREVAPVASSAYALQMAFASATDHRRLVLSFYGVRDLRLGNLEGLLALVIDIQCIRENQWEDLHYRIVESEENTFSFYCDRFDAEVVT